MDLSTSETIPLLITGELDILSLQEEQGESSFDDGSSARHSQGSLDSSTTEQEQSSTHEHYQDYLQLMKTLRFPDEINIAVIGSIKHGKSTLINTLLNFTVDANGNYPEYAAKVEESGSTTREAISFTSNQLRGVKLWDLPGIDGFGNKIKDYFQKYEINTNKFDFFIVVIAGEITTDAAYLLKEFFRRKLQFYIVRTHIDITIMNGRRLSRQQDDVIRNVRVNLGNQIADLVENWSNDENDNPTSLGYELYVVSAWERDAYDMHKLLKAIEINIVEKTQSNIQQKLTVVWAKLLKTLMTQLKKESEIAIASCAKDDTIPFKAKSSENLKFVLKCLQLLQLLIKDIEEFETNFQLQSKSLENFLDHRVSENDQNLQAVRKGATNLRFGDSDDLLSETAKSVLNGIQAGTAAAGGVGMAAGGAMVAAGYTAADVAAGTAATLTTGAVCGIAALVAAPIVAAGAVGGITAYRYIASKKGYEKELTKYLSVIKQISIDVHNEKVRLCKEAANCHFL